MSPPVDDPRSLLHLLESMCGIARAGGHEVMSVYDAGPCAFDEKSDASPVTQADLRAEAEITRALHDLARGWPVVGEEAVAAGCAPTATGPTFWLVDPLDGTREFLQRNGEFTVNIALVHEGAPVAGVVLAPATGRLYAGASGAGAWRDEGGSRTPIAARRPPAEGLTVVSSRSHGDRDALAAFLAGRKVARERTIGSSLKLCLVAEGEADVYPRLGRTMEWDIAAGHAVLAAAGGSVLTLSGEPLTYGKAGFENPHFVAWGRG